MLSLSSKIFKTKSYQDLRHPQNPDPYSNRKHAFTTTALTGLREDSTETVGGTPDANVTALPKQLKRKLSYFIRSVSQPTKNQPVANPDTKRSVSQPNPSTLDQDNTKSTPSAASNFSFPNWTVKLKSPFQGLKFGEERKKKAEVRKLVIGAPTDFQHVGTGGPVKRGPDGKAVEDTREEREEMESNESDWETVNERQVV
ncbi:hypothetical protein K469DRAFT_709092 [Zopfia rhizophila CBS 207.26]|uniref:CRIB domain-containing protein n=1 Tax=Zopfia rhizophila CBS 207.26 TaxID=1314779 RepID=A0A6A6DXE4_9PEZI|nr:hypothetical protein K469DRAFT_709092 [Zopfia rhizophila CBS 207.26]